MIFQPADILLPADADMRCWSVIACDQFTSDQAYWDTVEATVGNRPSTLRLMLPECYLGRCDAAASAQRIQDTMNRYLSDGTFRTVEHSIIYLERTLSGGTVRRGLIGMVDLEAYAYESDTDAKIRATEHTVADRLPPRVKVRAEASLEMPHIMLFFRDSEDRVMQYAASQRGECLYDFELMQGGGHVKGKRISGADADALAAYLQSVTSGQALQYAVGDGNHSLAAAKALWIKRREQLPASERMTDPARFALVEMVNIHDPAVTLEPIHRVLFGVSAETFLTEAKQALYDPNGTKTIVLLAGAHRETIPVCGNSVGQVIELTDTFCRRYLQTHGGEPDYIHGDDETVQLASGTDCVGILLPNMSKQELFSSVETTGPFPKKSFSIGLGPDKRYYLECRRLK